MAKKSMKRPEFTDGQTKEERLAATVPEIQGKAKSGKDSARPIIPGTKASSMKVYHTRPYSYEEDEYERQISSLYPEIDTDLARDNIENDIPYADLQDL